MCIRDSFYGDDATVIVIYLDKEDGNEGDKEDGNEGDKEEEALQERYITVRATPAYGFCTSSSPSETEHEGQVNN